MPMGGPTDLESGLTEGYGAAELLCGPNQYRCEICQRLVNARKVGCPVAEVSMVLLKERFEESDNFHQKTYIPVR